MNRTVRSQVGHCEHLTVAIIRVGGESAIAFAFARQANLRHRKRNGPTPVDTVAQSGKTSDLVITVA